MSARHACWCGRPVGPLSACSCCCAEHDSDVGATARALWATSSATPAPRTDAGPSIREFLASKGEI